MIRKASAALVIAILATGGTIAPASALTSTTKASLQFIVEEEKLARDVYTALAKTSGLTKFESIARSEQLHMDEIRALLKKYNIKDPTANAATGVFVNKDLQKLYTTLVAQGSVSDEAALAVGVSIEKLDIADLDKLVKTIAASDIKAAFANLRAGSVRHLSAFQRTSGSGGNQTSGNGATH